MAAREFACCAPVTVVGEDDADVGHGGFGEDAGDVAMLEGAFERVEIVELDDARGFGGIDRRADIAAARGDYTVFERGEGFVDGAVVAIVKNENFRTLGDFAGDSN